MLTKIFRLATCALVLAAFLMVNSVAAGVMSVAMNSALSDEITEASKADDNLDQRPTMAGCAYMKGCTHHLGGHCMGLALLRSQAFLPHFSVESDSLTIRPGAVARIAFPTGLFRPPIV